MEILWELGPSFPHLLVQARLAQLLHHQTVECLLQDGINFLFWMAQHRLSLDGCVLEEIHLSSATGRICPVSLNLDFKALFNYCLDLNIGPLCITVDRNRTVYEDFWVLLFNEEGFFFPGEGAISKLTGVPTS